MKKSINYLSLALILAISSCENNGNRSDYHMPTFPVETHSSFQLLTGELMANMVYDIFEHDRYLYAFFYDRKSQTWCHIYDKQSDEIKNIFVRGNGPNEIISLPICSSRRDSLFVFDLPVRKQISCSFSSLLQEEMSIDVTTLDTKPYARNICVTSSEKEDRIILNQIGYANPDTVGYHRLIAQDGFGYTVGYQDFEPFSDQVEMFNLYTESLMAADESGTHLAVGSVWGAIIELYTLPGLKKSCFLKMVDPSLTYGNVPALTRQTKAGLKDLFATDEYLYTAIGADVDLLPNGEKNTEDKELVSNDIFLLDWDGHPVKHIETDYNIEKMCVSASRDTIYAVVSDREKRLFLGYISDY